MERNQEYEFDPVGRGRRAEVVFGAVTDAERTVMQGIVGEQLAIEEIGPLRSWTVYGALFGTKGWERGERPS